jgi:TonB family protein
MQRHPAMPIAVSGTLHAAMAAIIALVASLGVARTQARTDDRRDLHMVFLVAPGPGGGGGGGGHKDPTPPPPAARKGTESLRSPITLHRAPRPVIAKARPVPPPRIDPPPMIRPAEPPPVVKADAMQPVFAPVLPAAADAHDREGMPWHAPASDSDSHGPGSGAGIGSGQGGGLGEGEGSGIGPGSGGGTGGGPYRPGAGITAPSILREVRPDYTDEGRRRGIEGDVVLEIVVRADGSVGSVKTLQGLGAGLDQRAIDAVRQWRFNPARRYGTPVDVIVEVAVEFKLR